ncbi:hypothetical protein BOTBODRAFT_147975 [Botryobasidium botryosum FD-172 SS1]|uniref:HNH nuclease domain-containing protein n=1 Tax=Botryobasidium botryosum (strain FD-172 SS1) TaxID=930990 RepID=A0A067ME75_BOTB1|nr:hypothetical protein BOTBODRAFT_147975 [Botryobasidium botryosum FD-172 SS1]
MLQVATEHQVLTSTTMSVPLPANPFDADTARHGAYARAVKYQEIDPVDGRLLGYMLLCAPLETGKDWVARSIISCSEDADLAQLSHSFMQVFLRPMRARGSSTPMTPTHAHPSRPSFEALQSASVQDLTQGKRYYKAAKVMALKRDCYRCVLTGMIDVASARKPTPHYAMYVGNTAGVPQEHTNGAHIIPAHLNQGVADMLSNEIARFYTGGVLTALELFGGIQLKELNGDDLHRTDNMMTLSLSAHTHFDQLNIWLEAVPDNPNTYTLRRANPAYLLGYPDIVTFTTTDPELLPLPNPRYLAYHAACARIAHMSGIVEYIEQYIQDVENSDTLAADGSSADWLCTRLGRFISVR